MVKTINAYNSSEFEILVRKCNESAGGAVDIGSSELLTQRFQYFIIILNLKAMINQCIRKTILSDINGLFNLMNLINIIKILYMSEIVLFFELLKNTYNKSRRDGFWTCW